MRRAARRADRRPDGAGDLARQPAPGPVRVLQQVEKTLTELNAEKARKAAEKAKLVQAARAASHDGGGINNRSRASAR